MSTCFVRCKHVFKQACHGHRDPGAFVRPDHIMKGAGRYGRDEDPATFVSAFRSVEITQMLPSWFDGGSVLGLHNGDGCLPRDGLGVDQQETCRGRFVSLARPGWHGLMAQQAITCRLDPAECIHETLLENMFTSKTTRRFRR
jgi:hypothetical protein